MFVYTVIVFFQAVSLDVLCFMAVLINCSV